MSQGRQVRGFSLLEMLVAMALTSMLAGTLYAALQVAFKGREATERALSRAPRAHAALSIMRADLGAAAGPRGLLAGEFMGYDGVGDNGEASDAVLLHAFATVQSPAPVPSPFERVQYGLATDEETGERVLVRSAVRNLLAPEEPEPTEEVVCRRVEAFDVRYFDGTSWFESWDSAAMGEALPLAVEVELTLQPGLERDKAQQVGYTAVTLVRLPCGEQGSADGGAVVSGGGVGR